MGDKTVKSHLSYEDQSINDLNWKEYWEHLEAGQKIFRVEAESYVTSLEKAVHLSKTCHVLDFGCGFGLVARTLAPKVSRICMWDRAANMLRQAARNTSDQGNVVCLEELDGSLRFDLILVNSVVQYMTCDELVQWLHRWSGLLRPHGRIVISDIIPQNIHSLLDMASLLSFSASRGFFFLSLTQGLRELKHYRKVRKSHPLLQLSRETVVRLSAEAACSAELLGRNLTYRRQRYTAVLTLQSPSDSHTSDSTHSCC